MLDFKLPENSILHIYGAEPYDDSLGIDDLKFSGRDYKSIKESVEDYIYNMITERRELEESLSEGGFSTDEMIPVWYDILQSIESLTVDILYIKDGHININKVGKVSELPEYDYDFIISREECVELIIDYIKSCLDFEKLNKIVSETDNTVVNTEAYVLYTCDAYRGHHGSDGIFLIANSLSEIKDSVKEKFAKEYSTKRWENSVSYAYSCINDNCSRDFYKIIKNKDNDFTFTNIPTFGRLVFEDMHKELPLDECVDYYVRCLIGQGR